MPDYKLTIHDLCIETTRRCNMACAHCMRGDAMNRDLDPALLDKLFSRLSGIGNVTPTGGEPSLNPAALLQIRDAILKYNIPVAGVYLVTNGKEITDEFLHNFLSLLLATEMDPEVSGLALSQDMFHDKISYANKAKLAMFSCFRDDDKKTDWTRTPVLNIGRGAEIVVVSNRDPYAFWPRLSTEKVNNNSQRSTWFMRDGSFLRLKSLEIGYTLPKKWLKKLGMDTVRIYYSGTNLLCFSKFDLWDPEMAEDGLGYPIQRVNNIGINFSF